MEEPQKEDEVGVKVENARGVMTPSQFLVTPLRAEHQSSVDDNQLNSTL